MQLAQATNSGSRALLVCSSSAVSFSNPGSHILQRGKCDPTHPSTFRADSRRSCRRRWPARLLIVGHRAGVVQWKPAVHRSEGPGTAWFETPVEYGDRSDRYLEVKLLEGLGPALGREASGEQNSLRSRPDRPHRIHFMRLRRRATATTARISIAITISTSRTPRHPDRDFSRGFRLIATSRIPFEKGNDVYQPSVEELTKFLDEVQGAEYPRAWAFCRRCRTSSSRN